jgi:signal transduction histidine kinase
VNSFIDTPYEDKDWILKHQIFALLTISLFFGLGVLGFAYIRFKEENFIVAFSQLILGLFMISGFFIVRETPKLYNIYSIAFMLLFYIYSFIIFFYVPQNTLNILWIISAPILIFFFLNRVGGTIMFILIFIFLLYLLLSNYPYSNAEYITLFASFFITTFVMYINENVKEAEKVRLLNYNKKLYQKVQEKTQDLQELNKNLEDRVKEELAKRIEQEQMMLRQCRMASMGEMIDSIAHQWRQPLMGINAILLNLDKAIEKNDSLYLEQKIDDIATITSYMSQTIEDFRDLLKPNKKVVVFNLKQTILEVKNLMSNSLKEIDFKIDIDDSLEIKSNKNEFIQAMIIFINNAKDALESRKIKNKIIEIKAFLNGYFLEIVIQDNGVGILKKDLEHIFKPYYTTKQQKGGSGLGLYVAKIIIEHNMDGKLDIQNIKDGVAIYIKIPKNLHLVTL